MRDITINNNESQDKNKKTTPVTKSFNDASSLDSILKMAIFEIWQGHEESNLNLGFWRPSY